jgi:hypothetical protein
MNNKYQVKALFSDFPKPFSEVIGEFSNKIQAQDAKEIYENQETAPNFMSCYIEFVCKTL